MIARCLNLAVAISLLCAGLASAQDEKTKWRYTPDAIDKMPKFPEGPWQLWAPKKINEFSNKTFVFPTTPSPYAVMLTGSSGPQLLDLVNRRGLPPLDINQHVNGALSPDGRFYTVIDDVKFPGKGNARVWSFQTGKQIMACQVKQGEALDWAEFGPSGKLVLSVQELGKDGKTSAGRHIEIRDIAKNGQIDKSFVRSKYGVANDLPVFAFSANRKALALPIIFKDRFGFRLYDLTSGEVVGTTDLTDKAVSAVRAACISPDGTKLASFHFNVNGGQKLLVWDLTNGKFITNANFGPNLAAPSLWVRQIFWLGDSKHLYFLGNIVADAQTAKQVYTFKDAAVKNHYFVAPAGTSDLLIWNRTNGESLQIVHTKLEK